MSHCSNPRFSIRSCKATTGPSKLQVAGSKKQFAFGFCKTFQPILFGPGSIYTELAKKLAKWGITALQLDHRSPNKLALCVEDVDAAIAELVETYSVKQVSLIGAYMSTQSCE